VRPRTPDSDFIGQTFGQLTVLEMRPNKGKDRQAFVRCECGTEKQVYLSSLKSGNAISCGCVRNQKATARLRKYQSENKTRPRNASGMPIKEPRMPRLENRSLDAATRRLLTARW